MVQYVTERYPHMKRELEQHHIHRAIMCDAAAVLEWIDENIANAPPAFWPLESAATFGAVDVLRHLHEHDRYRHWRQELMDCAAANGHLEVVRFLHEHRTEGCTTKAMNDAAANGHLEVVQFLHEHRTEGCSNEALERAASQNCGDMVAFFLEHRVEIDPASAFELALDQNHMDLVASMHCQRRRSLKMTTSPDVGADDPVWTAVKTMIQTYKHQPSCAIEAVARDGNLAVLQILTVHWHRQSTLNACIEAAVQRHERIVGFLVHNCLSAAEKRQLLRDAVNHRAARGDVVSGAGRGRGARVGEPTWAGRHCELFGGRGECDHVAGRWQWQ